MRMRVAQPGGTGRDAATADAAPSAASPISAPTRPTARDILSKSGGAPLPSAVRQQMERAFGAGFGRVRLHHGDEADAYDAAAFTAGERIFLPRNAPRLDSGEGRSLLAHELTHVLQQRHGRVKPPADGVSIDPHPQLEREALQTAASVMQGQAVPAWAGAAATAHQAPAVGGAAVQRAPKKGRRGEDEEEGIEMTPLRHAEPAEAENEPEPVATRPRSTTITQEPRQEATEPEPEKPKAEAPRKPEPKAAEPIPDDAIEKSRKRHKFVTNHLDAGQGGAGPALSQTDDGLRQAMAQMGDLAKQLEAAGRAGPAAPAPTVPWAQEQQAPGDPSSPPPLPVPDTPQPEPGPTITPDAPMSPLTANAPTYRSFKEMKQEEEQAKEALRERHEKHKAEAAAASSSQGAPA